MSGLASMLVCIGVLLLLLWMLRRDRASLGLPVAYLLALLLIHLPGGYAYVVSGGIYGGGATEIGLRITAIGCAAFLAGVWGGQALASRQAARAKTRPHKLNYTPQTPGRRFWVFCIVGGWILIYGVSVLLRLPSVGAIIEQGGAIWILGAMLGFAHAFLSKDPPRMAIWGSLTFVYPVMMLLLAGFLSYGSTAVIVVFAILTVAARRYWLMVGTLALSSFVGISVFVNYFAARTDLRNVVWGGEAIGARLDVITDAIGNFAWFSVSNPAHLHALDRRLNQNYFIGVAAERLEMGQVEFLDGRSITEGLMALIPRVLWPDKPVFGGSGGLVTELTGLNLNRDTSWGVGNVMEFYINYGMAGVVVGFVLLGFLIGLLDRKTVEALRIGDLGSAFVFFLPCIALIQPNGSIVELSGGAAAALAAGLVWRTVWRSWSTRGQVAPQPAYPRRL